MITPAQTTNRLNKDIGAVVRPLGFHGTRGTWSIVTTDGVAQVNVSRSVIRSVGGGTIFVNVGIGVVPVAWWEYLNWRAARWGQPPIPLDKNATSYRIGFVETRQCPEDSFYHLRLAPDRYPATVTTTEELDHAAALLVGAADKLAHTALSRGRDVGATRRI